VIGLRMQDDGIELDLQVVPRASKEGLGPLQGDRVKVRVGAPPVDGAANEAVRRLLAELFGVPRGEVRIARGETGRKKTVRIGGDPQGLARRVRELLGETS
jgi:uncharacterized protein